MNGSELMIKTLAASGVTVCFTNPGTTELPIVRAFDSVPGIRSVLCLFEGVCTGAADGFGRMTDSPAMTLLHLGPGLGNGLANLHNAKRAGTPLLNVVGEHALWHRPSDPPLAMNIDALLRTVSGWQALPASAERIAHDAAAAVTAAREGMIASLAIPFDLQLATVGDEIPPLHPAMSAPVDETAVADAVTALRNHGKTVALILGGRSLRKETLLAAARIVDATGCDIFCETFPARIEKGKGLPALKRIPYFPQQAMAELARFRTLILVGAREPIPFFGWPGSPERYTTENQTMITLSNDPLSVRDAVVHLAEGLGLSGRNADSPDNRTAPGDDRIVAGELTAENACAILAELQPDGAIVVDEAITAGMIYYTASHAARPHTVLGLTGGAIGTGIPLSVGAAIACPDRPVIDLQADGSAMYTLQGLWTQARESLNITTLICSNRSYDILKLEMALAGNVSPGPQSQQSTMLDNPPLDWVALGKGMGVPSVSVTTTDQLEKALKRSLAEPGPKLIEMRLKTLF